MGVVFSIVMAINILTVQDPRKNSTDKKMATIHQTVAGLVSSALVNGQLTGSVGPTTARTAKTNICNVLNYGGSIGSSDIGPAILSAFTNCVLKTSGSTLYLPSGDYNMQTWVTLNAATKWAFRMDGFITRTSTTTGHMIVIQNANDFEMYSANSKGGFQGNGYQCRNAGPRFLRIVTSTNWSVHDLIMVDSPEFHLVVQQGSNGEIYNLVIRGANIGGSDGIDVSGTNHWVHDVEVTNRDECVTIKSPAHNILVERSSTALPGGGAASTSTASTSTTKTTTTTTTKTSSASATATGTAAHYGQCGGSGWTGPTVCESPYTCTYSNDWYSQCL
ncbi:pectin lyase-like protein [Serendipita vermifera]|nr:pectin lyase-like protein [Serendipita vermifera]